MDFDTSIIGETIGHYEISSYLGKGSMGEVFLGVHPKIGRKVAVKVLNSYLCARPDMVQRFTVEAESVNRINHPNIIQVFDFGELPDGRLYLIMEYLEGKDLEAIIKKGPLPMEDVRVCFAQLASALQAAHDEGIIHRDLKPENIFVCQTKVGLQVKILDFGIAKLFDLAEDSLSKHKMRTQRGAIMGTPLYMSPEQARGEVERISPQSDIYSLAIIIYKMLSGKLPIEGETVYKTLAMHSTDPPVPLTQFCPELGEAIWEALAVALEKAPLARYPSVRAFFKAFEEAAEAPIRAPSPIIQAVDRAPSEAQRPLVERAPSIGTLDRSASLEIQDVGKTSPKMFAITPPPDSSLQRGSRFGPTHRHRRGRLGVVGMLLLLVPGAAAAFGYYSYQNVHTLKPMERRAVILEKNAIFLEDLDGVEAMKRQIKARRQHTHMWSGGIFVGVSLLALVFARLLRN